MPVVPLSTIAPTSRLEKPADARVFLAEADAARQQHDRRGELQAAKLGRSAAGGAPDGALGRAVGAVLMGANYRLNCPHVFEVILYRAGDPAQHRQYHPAVREHRLPACT